MTLVERSSRYVLLGRLPGGHTAEEVPDVLVPLIGRQRGSNENTNGLLRQYFPKGTDLNAYDPEELELVAHKLNRRPRETLGWKTPAERLRDLLTAT